ALAGLELRRLRRCDLDLLASARIAAGARGALGDHEITEADDLHFLARFQAGGDGIERRVDGLARASFRHAGAFRNCRDEIILVHEASLSLIRAESESRPRLQGRHSCEIPRLSSRKRRNPSILMETAKRRKNGACRLASAI